MDFLKPTKLKIAILIVLLILTLVSALGKMIFIVCITLPCPQPFPAGNGLFIRTNDFLAWPYILVQKVRHPVQDWLFQTFNKSFFVIRIWWKILMIIGAVFTLLYQYLLSCILVSILTKK